MAITKGGKPIEFRRDSHFKEHDFFPYIVIQLTARVDGKRAAYMRISYIPRENWDKAYPHLLDHVARGYPSLRGWRHYSKEGMLASLRCVNNTWPFEPTAAQREDEAALDRLIERERRILERKHLDKYHEAEFFYVDKPLVAFVRVEDAWQRQGIGTALYIEATRWMHERGMLLHASDTQSDDAKKMWVFLKARMHYKKVAQNFYDPVGEPKQFRYALDPKKLDLRKTHTLALQRHRPWHAGNAIDIAPSVRPHLV